MVVLLSFNYLTNFTFSIMIPQPLGLCVIWICMTDIIKPKPPNAVRDAETLFCDRIESKSSINTPWGEPHTY